MTAPVVRQFPGTIPDKGQSQTAFDTNVDAFLDWQALQFAPDLVAFVTWSDEIAAALVAENLPSLAGKAGKFLRVNAGETAAEFATARTESVGPSSATGASVDFTSIPAGVMEITAHFLGVSVSVATGGRQPCVRFGTSSGFVTSGYNQLSSIIGGDENQTTLGFAIKLDDNANTVDGHMTFKRTGIGLNTWTASHAIKSGNNACAGGGFITLASELTQLRFSSDILDGSTTFDAGNVALTWGF
jgi:hypothetical protein